MKRNIYKIFLIILFVLIANPLVGASFNCKKASTAIENTICMDDELSTMDSRLGSLYKKIKNSISNRFYRKQFIQDSKNWLNKRNRCHNINCLRQEYKKRIYQLKQTFNTLYGKQHHFDSIKIRTHLKSKIPKAFPAKKHENIKLEDFILD